MVEKMRVEIAKWTNVGLIAGELEDEKFLRDKSVTMSVAIDVFVAKHNLLQRDIDGSLVSFAVLPKGLDLAAGGRPRVSDRSRGRYTDHCPMG